MDLFSYVRWTFFPHHRKFDGPIFRGPIFLMDFFTVDVFTEYLSDSSISYENILDDRCVICALSTRRARGRHA